MSEENTTIGAPTVVGKAPIIAECCGVEIDAHTWHIVSSKGQAVCFRCVADLIMEAKELGDFLKKATGNKNEQKR